MNSKPTIWVADSPHRLDYLGTFIEDYKASYNFILDHPCIDTISLKPLKHADLLLYTDERTSAVATAVQQARSRKIPSLFLTDGILEYRNIFSNPNFGFEEHKGIPLFFPTLADRVACIGDSQVHLLNGLTGGNKAVSTGIPSVSGFLKIDAPTPKTGILIATAKTPYFNDRERDALIRFLRDIREEIQKHSIKNVTWRISPQLATEIEVETTFGKTDLIDDVKKNRLIFSTPSTVILQCLAADRTTCTLNPYKIPLFAPTCYEVRQANEFMEVLNDMDAPSPSMQLLATHLKNYHICTDSTRLQWLIDRMIRESRRAKEQADTPNYATQRDCPPASPSGATPGLSSIFPDRDWISGMSAGEKMAELAHLRYKTYIMRITIKTLSTPYRLNHLLKRIFRF